MFNKIILSVFVCLFANLLISAQENISSNDLKYIQNQAAKKTQTFEDLLNLIGDVNTFHADREELIKASYRLLVRDETVFVEDDLIQDRSKVRNVRIEEYLYNVYLYFKESGVRFTFENMRVSQVFQEDYMFILVYCDRLIDGKSIYHNALIQNSLPRVLEFAVDKTDNGWDLNIIGIRFPSEKDIQQEYTQVSVYESQKNLTLENRLKENLPQDIKQNSRSTNVYRPKAKLTLPISLSVIGVGSIVSGIIIDQKALDKHQQYLDNQNPNSEQYTSLSRDAWYQEANQQHQTGLLLKYGGYAALGVGLTWMTSAILKNKKQDRLQMGWHIPSNIKEGVQFGLKLNF